MIDLDFTSAMTGFGFLRGATITRSSINPNAGSASAHRHVARPWLISG
jgi:hypothetical protein